MILFHTTAMPRGWERHTQTGRTLFDWPHYTILYTLTPTNYFILGEMHKLQISVILAGFFKFSLHWLSEGRGHFPLGKGVLFWLFALELYFQKLPQHFKRDLFTRSPIKGFPKHEFIEAQNVVSRGWTLMRLSYHVLELKRGVIGESWNLQEDRGVPADETCFLLL